MWLIKAASWCQVYISLPKKKNIFKIYFKYIYSLGGGGALTPHSPSAGSPPFASRHRFPQIPTPALRQLPAQAVNSICDCKQAADWWAPRFHHLRRCACCSVFGPGLCQCFEFLRHTRGILYRLLPSALENGLKQQRSINRSSCEGGTLSHSLAVNVGITEKGKMH